MSKVRLIPPLYRRSSVHPYRELQQLSDQKLFIFNDHFLIYEGTVHPLNGKKKL